MTTTRSRLSAAAVQRAAWLAFGLVAGFVVVLGLLHVIEPEFDPSWRWISEYQLGRYGWVMSLAFVVWGSGALALLVAVWSPLRTPGGRLGRWWLLLIGIAMLGAGVFVTVPITAATTTTAGDLHDTFGMFTILTFPIMATLLARGLTSNQEWRPARRRLLWATLATWVGQLAFWAAVLASVVINHADGPGPQVLAGWPNRLMAVTYATWLLTLAWCAAHTANPKRPRNAA